MGDADAAAWTAADPAAHPLAHPGRRSSTATPTTLSPRGLDRLPKRQGPNTGQELLRLPGVGHMELIDPAEPAFRVVLDAVARLAGS